MSKVYDKAFRVGVGINLLLFLILNIGSCAVAEAEYLNRNYSNQGLRLSSGGYKWGFPFDMYYNFYGFPNDIGFDLFGLIGNALAVVLCSFVTGFLSQIIWSEVISRRSAKL